MLEESLPALAVELPEDVARLKAGGDWKRAERVIRKRLEKDLPKALRERLLLELEILERIPGEYPFAWDEAVKEAQGMFRDFTGEELEALLEEGAVEWIYLDGTIHLKDNFVANLVKTRADLTDRILQPEAEADRQENFRMLNDAIRVMKEHESVRCQFHVRSALTVCPERQRPGKRIQVQLPLPVLDSQVKKVRVLDCGILADGKKVELPSSIQIAPETFPQRTVCFETEYQAGMEFYTEFTFETQMRYWDWEKAQAELDQQAGQERQARQGQKAGQMRMAVGSDGRARDLTEDPDVGPYLKEQMTHIRFTPYLQALTAEVIGEETEPLKKAKRIYDYITSHVMYSFVRPYFTIEQQATFTASNMKGDCGLQALLFITMCRIAGVPARWQSGLYANPRGIGCHDWAQFYLEPYGWLYADCSFGGAAARAGAGERREFYFGNLEPYRMVAASQYQHGFYFPKRFLRQDPYDNQMGEAEYEDENLAGLGGTETRHEMLAITLTGEKDV